MLKKLREDRWLPVLAQVAGPDGTPELCVVEAPPDEGEEARSRVASSSNQTVSKVRSPPMIGVS